MVTKIGRFVELKDQPAAKEIGCVFTLEAVKVIPTAGLYSTLEENQETMLHTVKLESEWRVNHTTRRAVACGPLTQSKWNPGCSLMRQFPEEFLPSPHPDAVRGAFQGRVARVEPAQVRRELVIEDFRIQQTG